MEDNLGLGADETDKETVEINRIDVGVTGWKRNDWLGVVYPGDLPEEKRLNWLLNEHKISVVDLDETYSNAYDSEMFEKLLDNAQDGPDFILRVHKDICGKPFDSTGTLVRNEWAVNNFVESLQPFSGSNRLRFVLAQFPAKFVKNDESIESLKWVIDKLRKNAPLALEMGHESWGSPSTYDLFRSYDVTFSLTDKPVAAKGAPLKSVATADEGLLRFLGRSEKWFGGSGADRYHYIYPEYELRSLIGVTLEMKKITKRTTALFGNSTNGACVKNAKRFTELLGHE